MCSVPSEKAGVASVVDSKAGSSFFKVFCLLLLAFHLLFSCGLFWVFLLLLLLMGRGGSLGVVNSDTCCLRILASFLEMPF